MAFCWTVNCKPTVVKLAAVPLFRGTEHAASEKRVKFTVVASTEPTTVGVADWFDGEVGAIETKTGAFGPVVVCVYLVRKPQADALPKGSTASA